MLCHPDASYVIRMTYTPLTISHPDEILPIAKSCGRLMEQFSFIWYADDLLHWQWVYCLMHMILGLVCTPDLPIRGPLWGNPPVMRLFDTATALSLHWASCWSINQSAGEFRSCGTPMVLLYCHGETLNNLRYVRRLEISGDGNTANFIKCPFFFQHQYHSDNLRWNVFKLSIFPFHWYRMGI